MKQNISLRVILIFTILILLSFIPEYLKLLFGDWLCEGSGEIIGYHYKGCNYANTNWHNPTWHWGYRHWLWIIMGISLTIVQIGKIIEIIDNN